MKILIVDADDTSLSYLRKGLEGRGYEVEYTHMGNGGSTYTRRTGLLSRAHWFSFYSRHQIKDGLQLLSAIREMNPRANGDHE